MLHLLLSPVKCGMMDPHPPTRTTGIPQLTGEGMYTQPEAVRSIIITHGDVSFLLNMVAEQQDGQSPSACPGLIQGVAPSQRQNTLRVEEWNQLSRSAWVSHPPDYGCFMALEGTVQARPGPSASEIGVRDHLPGA